MVGAISLDQANDELRANIAREVEVDVWYRGQLVVEEPPERETCIDGIDVRETRQVADDRADRAPTAAAWW